MRECTNLGQDKEKITRLVRDLHEIIERYYPEEVYTGLQLFEILDALALYTVYTVTLEPKLCPTAKKYFSQRLMEFSERSETLDDYGLGT